MTKRTADVLVAIAAFQKVRRWNFYALNIRKAQAKSQPIFKAKMSHIVVPELVFVEGWWPGLHSHHILGFQMAAKAKRQSASFPISQIWPQRAFFSSRGQSHSWLTSHCPMRASRWACRWSSEQLLFGCRSLQKSTPESVVTSLKKSQ